MSFLRQRTAGPRAAKTAWAAVTGLATIFLSVASLAAQGGPQSPLAAAPSKGGVDPLDSAETDAPGESSDSIEQALANTTHLGNPKDVFAKVEFPCDSKSRPTLQTIRLNEKVIVKEGERYSGFWFVVDRSEFAQKQGFDKRPEKMFFYWYFLPPRPMHDWAVGSATGVMQGGWSYCSLKLDGFKKLQDAPPPGKNCLILQGLDGSRLKEGKEYYMEFGFPLQDTRPVEMTFCAGYRESVGSLRWSDNDNKALHFLGLEHRVSSAGKFDWKHSSG